eukprot:5686143-Prymnesium_polylepis.1
MITVGHRLRHDYCGPVKRMLESFKRYTEYPTSLGLSDAATIACDGSLVGDAAWFPWCLLLRPTATAQQGAAPEEEPVPDAFLRQLARLEPGSVIYDVFAARTPAAMPAAPPATPRLRWGSAVDEAHPSGEGLVRIGHVVLRSKFVRSAADDKLVFWHQRKEDDYAHVHAKGWEREHTKYRRDMCDAETLDAIVARMAFPETAVSQALETGEKTRVLHQVMGAHHWVGDALSLLIPPPHHLHCRRRLHYRCCPGGGLSTVHCGHHWPVGWWAGRCALSTVHTAGRWAKHCGDGQKRSAV